VLTDILEHSRVGGRLSVVALHYRPVPTSFLLVLMKVHDPWSMEYPSGSPAIDLLAATSALVTDRVPIDQFDQALATLPSQGVRQGSGHHERRPGGPVVSARLVDLLARQHPHGRDPATEPLST
jgi:hypothetical protein